MDKRKIPMQNGKKKTRTERDKDGFLKAIWSPQNKTTDKFITKPSFFLSFAHSLLLLMTFQMYLITEINKDLSWISDTSLIPLRLVIIMPKSEQQPPHLPATRLIKTSLFTSMCTPECHGDGMYGQEGKRAGTRPSLLHSTKPAPFPAVQIPLKMWEAHL